MSRILITGAAGFIGSHVVGSLLKPGHLVILIDNLSSGQFFNLPLHRRRYFREWDILDLRLMDVAFHNFEPEVVIHLAAQPSLQASWKDALFDARTNILGTVNLLGLCQRYNVKKFVFASTAAVYAPRVDGVYYEDSEIRPQSPYGVSKAAAETFIRISGIPYVILRLGNVYGPRQVPLGENQLIPRALAHIYQNEPFEIYGDGEQKRDFVYVEDVADAFVDAVDYPYNTTFNIGSGSSTQVRVILSMLNVQLEKIGCKVSYKWKHGPAKPGELNKIELDKFFTSINLGWEARTGLVNGLRKTIEAWPK